MRHAYSDGAVGRSKVTGNRDASGRQSRILAANRNCGLRDLESASDILRDPPLA